MIELDHLTVFAPTLREGVAHVRDCLDLDMPLGGAHREMGTHNHLLRLGDDVFLEVIAVDPQAEQPPWPRWFGLDDQAALRRAWDAGLRLRGWVARTRDIDALLAEHGALFGEKRRVSRGDLAWHFAVPKDGSLPGGGSLPSVMSWGDGGTPAPRMPDLCARLRAFEVELPDPAALGASFERLGASGAPIVRHGDTLRYRATIETPGGSKLLT